MPRRRLSVPIARAARSRARALVRRFRTDRDGVTAIEFSFVGVPVIALLAAIVETGLTLWATSVLQTQVSDAARLIYTGQFQNGQSGTPDELLRLFRKEICRPTATLFKCDATGQDPNGSPKISIAVYDTAFPNGGLPPALDSGAKDWNSGFNQYQTAKAGQIAVVRAAIKFPTFFGKLYPTANDFADGSRLIQASVAFKVEPYK